MAKRMKEYLALCRKILNLKLAVSSDWFEIFNLFTADAKGLILFSHLIRNVVIAKRLRPTLVVRCHRAETCIILDADCRPDVSCNSPIYTNHFVQIT